MTRLLRCLLSFYLAFLVKYRTLEQPICPSITVYVVSFLLCDNYLQGMPLSRSFL